MCSKACQDFLSTKRAHLFNLLPRFVSAFSYDTQKIETMEVSRCPRVVVARVYTLARVSNLTMRPRDVCSMIAYIDIAYFLYVTRLV